MRVEIIGDDNKVVRARSTKSLRDGDFVALLLVRLVEAKSTAKIAMSKVRHFILGLIVLFYFFNNWIWREIVMHLSWDIICCIYICINNMHLK